MFAAPHLHHKKATYIDLDDVDFFQRALNYALSLAGDSRYDDVPVSDIKRKHTPVVYCSRLSKQTPEEMSMMRKDINRSGRAQRKFIMIDADFDPGQEEESRQMRQKMLDLADSLNTPILIYPTVSYPEKPRFRAVMFTQRPLSESGYYQAMRWWYDQLGYDEPLDEADTRLSANRNLPVFINQKQADGVVSTLDRADQLDLLPGSLWKNYPRPRKKKKSYTPAPTTNVAKSADTGDVFDDEMSRLGLKYDIKDLIDGMREFASHPDSSSYEGTWKMLRTLAAEYTLWGRISEKTMLALTDTLAEAATDDPAQQEAWKAGNRAELGKHIERLHMDADERNRVSPLYTKTEFMAAMR